MAQNCRTQFRRTNGAFSVAVLMAICVGGVVLLTAGHVAPGHRIDSLQVGKPQQQQEESQPRQPDCTCDLSKDEGLEVPTAVTLSIEKLAATLECKGENAEVVPETSGKVCTTQAEGATISDCKNNNTQNAEQVSLKGLLGTAEEIEWSSPSQEPNTSKFWQLQLTPSQLPRSDKAFFVGCVKDQNNTTSKCKLTVNVEARKSAVNNNVATCAYGQKSNPQPLKVEMTGEANTVTIDCGDDGTLAPGSYMTEYCVDDGKSLRECEKKAYADVFPGFEQSWWKAEESTKQAPTLTIPASGFPSEDQQLLLGCVPTRKAIASRAAGAPGSQALGEADAANTGEETSCKVLVTVKAVSSFSGARSLFHSIVIVPAVGAYAAFRAAAF
ncbi:SAG-related sequence [Besnoitia besnoiti]|uniref:SAG-related sequence n=1 Tax=Besnoitia besnoiti TaxID=94643 RepID=A0A2A9MIM2_BESBE|nr:SAG-related sequence [Besnoitia besnoiti]PFH37759.1 SAG-related sequence [Besnoitia besnoiti]